ncbi:hypothetical protein BCV72DRAFT_243538 [Rhizopus microsporus var. microsporus]|uniref:PH domain-containing protein n=2 Tax=Rhizopus microsporus TaxID=58291 RepID=A0A2G4SSV3_RHIZD|nr:uncharacterized protein RHIMIDRAFT_244292 [Rhizopus microsporus ATCC 52813]ORE04506.1 hypothetical protein BCV72DRAFT_243538 [Rhizopus microsporus var. microsporus]PHZ11840.1 hypothetical protein RHIMIDRAFT_244292 [Rhizopus microsporus ATCC 52813]
MNSIIRLDPIDTSNVVDLFTEKPILNYQLEPISKILFKHTFYCIELEEHVQVLLTKTHLVISTDNNHLLCPSILIDHVRVRSTQSDCNDEYWLQFLIQERKALTLKTSSKEDRDLWLVSTQPSAWSPLEQTVISRSRPKPIKTTDIFSFYNDPEGEISPLESSDEEDSTSDTKREEYTYSATPSDTMQKAITPSPPPLPQHSQVPDPTLNKPLPVRNHSLKQLPATPPETIIAATTTAPQKKPSFMRSVLSAVGSPRLRKSQSITPLPRQAPITLNQSSVSLDRQTIPTPQRNSSLLDPAQQPRGSYLLHHQSSNSSFSSSQSSLATPPLSRSSSPGSSTPISRLQTPTSLSSAEDLEDQQRSTPPASPDMQLRNTIKQVIYRDDQCQVFHWKDESWYAVEDDQCVLEVRQTYSNRTCITIHMMNTRQMYLNAWILPDTSIQRISDTDINLTVQFGGVEDNYLFHCATNDSASQLDQVLQQVHLESAQLPMTDTVRGSPPLLDETTQQEEDLEKSLKLALQCKCKLYIQSSSAKWSSFGSVHMKVSQHYTTKKMHMAIESHKGGKVTKLVSAMVQSRNVERLGPKRITFLFVNGKTSVVYMVQVREELTGDKIIEYLKEKNAENGW